MKFITNKISTGPARTFNDLINDYKVKTAAAAGQIKTAQTEEVVEDKQEEDVVESSGADKKINDKGEVSSGQLVDEPHHQIGESTPKPHKDNTEAAAAAALKKAESGEKDEADSSGHPEWEGKDKNVNDPEAGKHREGDGDQDKSASTKEAGGDFGGKKAPPFGSENQDDDADDDKKEDTESSAKSATKTAECECGEKGCEECDDDVKESKAKSDDDDDDDVKEAKADDDDDDKDGEEKEAKSNKFIRIANLNGKSKTWLRDYWKNIFPDAYVDAMLSDK